MHFNSKLYRDYRIQKYSEGKWLYLVFGNFGYCIKEKEPQFWKITVRQTEHEEGEHGGALSWKIKPH